MDMIIQNKLQEIEANIPLGERVKLLGLPADGNFLLSNTTVLRSSYPELSEMYPPKTIINRIDQSSPMGIPSNLLYGNNVMLLVATFNRMYSTDFGVTWNTPTTFFANSLLEVFFQGKFYSFSVNGDAFHTSVDGDIWSTYLSMGFTPGVHIWTYSFANDAILILTDSTGNIAYTTDGITWIEQVIPIIARRGIILNDNVFLISMNTVIVASLSDLTTWINTYSFSTIFDIDTDGTNICIVGNSYVINSTSISGTNITWDAHLAVNGSGYQSATMLCNGNGQYASSFGNTQTVYFSKDGLAPWINYPVLDVTGQIYNITFINNIFYILCSGLNVTANIVFADPINIELTGDGIEYVRVK